MDGISFGVLAALVGLGGGMVLGLAARLGDFCTLGAVESAVYGRNQTRLRMWGVALGVGILATFALRALGLADIEGSFYYTIDWDPLASIAGGLMFGFGMAYAGNCGFGALARIGSGDLRAVVTSIVMAIFAYMTLGGPLAGLREFLFPQEAATATQGYAHLLAGMTGLPVGAVAAAIGLALLLWGLVHPGLRARPHSVFWSAMVGLAIASAWWGTTALAEASLGEVTIQGHSYTAPLGRSLIYLMTSTAGGINFSVGSVAGVILGGFLGSAIKGYFRWEACEDPQELGRQMMGAALMGVGGVTALGCSIGQGLTAFSTLTWSAPVTLASIVVGAMFGLRRLVHGFQPE